MFSPLENAGILTHNVLHKPAARNTLHSLTAPCYVSRLTLEIKLEKCDTVQTVFYLLTALCAAVFSTSLVMMFVIDVIRSWKTKHSSDKLNVSRIFKIL